MATEITSIIGFDLGHAETSVSHLVVGPHTVPQVCEVIPGARVVRTIVGSDPDGRTVIGDEAVIRRDVVDLHAKFKAPGAGTEPTIRFVRAVLGRLAETGIVPTPATLVVFGHPAGWTADHVAAYRTLLRDLCAPAQVLLMAESRAAFLTVVHQPHTAVTETAIRERILIVDIGSSTTDFTVAERGETWDALHDRGNFQGVALGAGLIEDFLFERCLSRAANRADIEQWFAVYPGDRVRAVVELRKAKEEFFTAEATYRHGGISAVRTVDLGAQPGLRLEMRLTPDDFDAALDSPLPELAGMSWRQRFRADLRTVAETLAGETPTLAVVTGGGARMAFTEALARETFGDATLVIRGQQPEHAISVGLAWGGSVRLRIDSFRREIRQLTESGALRRLITDERLRALATGLAGWQAGEVADHILPRYRVEWGRRQITIGEASAVLAKEFNQRLGDPAVTERLNKHLEAWMTRLVADMSDIVAPVATRFDIRREASKLRITDDNVMEMRANLVGGAVLSMVQMVILVIGMLVFVYLLSLLVVVLFIPKVEDWLNKTYDRTIARRRLRGRLWHATDPAEVAQLFAKWRKRAVTNFTSANEQALGVHEGTKPNQNAKETHDKLVAGLEQEMSRAVEAWADQVEILIV